MQGKKKGLIPSFLLALLFFFSLFFSAAVYVKNLSFKKGLRKKRSVPACVISIGSITAGGAGKTPFTLFLAEELLKRGKKTAVLSRGYLSSSENKKTPLLACDGKGPLFSFREMGDEPYLLAKRAPDIVLYTGKNRVMAAELALKKAPFLLLDDGFQYRKLKRDLEIVMIDPSFPLKRFLPFGYLRDFPKRLKEADVVAAQIEGESEGIALEAKLRPNTNAPFIGFKPIFRIMTLKGEEMKDLGGEKAALFCAIAKPERFLRSVKEKGIQASSIYIAPDHEEIVRKEFIEDAKRTGAKYLLCTEKDAVKLQDVKTPLPILYLEMEWQMIYGQKEWGKIIEKILNMGDNIPYER